MTYFREKWRMALIVDKKEDRNDAGEIIREDDNKNKNNSNSNNNIGDLL